MILFCRERTDSFRNAGGNLGGAGSATQLHFSPVYKDKWELEKGNTVAVVVAGWVLHHRTDRVVPTPPEQTEPLSARRALRSRLPAPRMLAKAVPLEAPAENRQPTNAFARLLNNDGNPPGRSRAQVEAYLAENQRSAKSLLAAFRLTGSRSLLQELSEQDQFGFFERMKFSGELEALRWARDRPGKP